MKEQVLLLGDEYIKPRNDLKLSSTFDFLPPDHDSKDKLRIDTYSTTELHDRYLSDEEEPSPSAEDSASEDDVEEKTSARENIDNELGYAAVFECKADIAVAVPIVAIGRPKLVDITNIAPMQKRKRPSQTKQVHSTLISIGTRLAPVADENDQSNEQYPVKSSYSAHSEENSSILSTAPDSWLPEQESEGMVEEEDFSAYSGIVPPSTYNEHDPYNLEPPCLRSSPPRKCTIRKHNHPPSSMKNKSAWRDLTRSLSLAKKQEPQIFWPQRTKKVKFLVRAAQENEPTMVIPPLPFETKAWS